MSASAARRRLAYTYNARAPGTGGGRTGSWFFIGTVAVLLLLIVSTMRWAERDGRGRGRGAGGLGLARRLGEETASSGGAGSTTRSGRGGVPATDRGGDGDDGGAVSGAASGGRAGAGAREGAARIELPVGVGCEVVRLQRPAASTASALDADARAAPAAGEDIRVGIRVRHGLGNRLRSLSSAMVLAQKLANVRPGGRTTLIVVWERDVHCRASFSDLFLRSGEGAFAFDILVRDEFDADEFESFDYYDYSECPTHAVDAARILRGRNALIESSYPIQTKYDRNAEADFTISKQLEGRFVRKLLFEHGMSDFVRGVVERHGSGDGALVGVHSRSLTNLEKDVPGIGALGAGDEGAQGTAEHDAHVNGADNMGGPKLLKHRASCSVMNFIPKMRQLLEMNAAMRFYVAADDRDTYKKLEEAFGDRIDYLRERDGASGGGPETGNDCYDDPRTAYCTQLALAEVVIVSTKTFKQILSTGSSYSALIASIAGYFSPSGCAIGHNKKKYRTHGADGKRRDVSIVMAATPDRLDIVLGEGEEGGSGGVLTSWLREISVEAEIILVFWMLGGDYSTGVDYSSERAAIRERVSELVRSVVGEYNHSVYPRLVRCVFATADDAAGNGVLHTWLLPLAYNLGISLASGRYLLKLDADNILSQGFFNNIELQQWILHRGLWCSGAEHLNGVFLAPLSSVLNIRGYDERLVIYGADDSDIYQRLIGGGADCNKCALMLKPEVVRGELSATGEGGDGPTQIEPLWQRELTPDMVLHKDHSNQLRVRNQVTASEPDGNSTTGGRDAVSSFVGIRIPMNPALRIKLNYSLLQNAAVAWNNNKESVSSWSCSTDGVHAHCLLQRQAASFPAHAYEHAERKLRNFMKKSNKSYDYLPEERSDAVARDPDCHLLHAGQQ